MGRFRYRVFYLVLLPAIVVAGGILGYYTWVTASQFSQLGEEALGQSTLLLVREKVEIIEQYVIGQDNAVFRLVELDQPAAVEEAWPPVAEEVSPSVRSILVLDDSGTPIAHAFRGTDREKRDLRKVFEERILPDLELERQAIGRLKHLHGTYAGESTLISYEARRHRGRRYYVIAIHDLGIIVREQFPRLFATEEGKRLYNVVDEENRRIYGPSLANAGDYLVGHRFPTTLYNWRLQVAPKQAPELEAQARERRLTEVGLIATSLLVILLGAGFLLYAADKERRLNALKSEFIANVSHELKTPLSVVRMFGEMLLTKRVKNEDKNREYLEIICRESERLSGLIDNVLDFAALERGKRTYALRKADLKEVLQRAVDAFRNRVEPERSDVSIRYVSEPPLLHMDDQAVLLAVVNLLDNAAKYGAGTPIEVIVEPRERLVEIRVRDHGPGIPELELRRVFERFYRIRRDAQARGSGIGLSLVKHIAEAHGGKAWAANAEGGGAVVSFSIPRPRRTGEQDAAEPDAVAAEE